MWISVTIAVVGVTTAVSIAITVTIAIAVVLSLSYRATTGNDAVVPLCNGVPVARNPFYILSAFASHTIPALEGLTS
jgi:hypothetical protein